MIKSFRHAGLEKFFRTGSKAGIQAAHATKLRVQLLALNNALVLSELNVPNWKLHSLSGDLTEHWSIRVNRNWRITFRFENGNAILVDYRDYH